MIESAKPRVIEVQKIVVENYEAGNQKKCYHAIWRNIIFPKYKIAYRTMLRMLRIKPSELQFDEEKIKNVKSGTR